MLAPHHALHRSPVSFQVVLAGVAAGLSVDVEDLGFADLAFFQGGEFPIENEFSDGFDENSSDSAQPGLCFCSR